MTSKIIRLRYAGTCHICGATLAASTSAGWESESRTVTCLACLKDIPIPNEAKQVTPPMHDSVVTAILSREEMGNAGVSADKEYQRRHHRRDERIDEQWGRFAGVVKFLSDDPQSTKAWLKGSLGEQRLAKALQRDVGDRGVLLNDRQVPRTRGNIDHIVIAPTGIWVIDAKNYKGLVERKNKGGLFRDDYRLYVKGRDRTNRVEGLGWQIQAVRTALADQEVPITAALCFTDSEWRLFAKPFLIDGVLVVWEKALAEMIGAPGPLDSDEVLRIGASLAHALPPKVAH